MRTSYVPAVAGIVALALAGGLWLFGGPTGAQAGAPEDEPKAVPSVVQSNAFYEELDFGETREIIRNGPIAFEARCEHDIDDFDNPGSRRIDVLSLFATTEVPGALGEGFGLVLNPDTPERVRRSYYISDSPPGDFSFDNFTTGFEKHSLIAPSGEVIMLDPGNLVLALNALGGDCVAYGTYQTFDVRF
jgi:hypothetical protein